VTSICTQLYLSFMPSSYLLPLTSIYTPLKNSSLDFPGWYLYQPTGIELEPSFLPLFFENPPCILFFCFGLSLINLMANWRQRGRAQKQGGWKEKSPTNVTNRTRGQCQRTQCTTDTDLCIYLYHIYFWAVS